MKSRLLSHALVGLAAASGLLVSTVGVAQADTGSTSVDGGTISTDSGSKSDPVEVTHPSPDSTCRSGNASIATNTNGGGAFARVSGSTHYVESDGWSTYYDFTSSKGDFRWLGSNPYYAYSMTPRMQWEANGVDIDLRVPGGVTFHDRGNDTISWEPGTNTHIWHQTMSYPGDIHFETSLGTISSAAFHLGVSIQYTKGNYFYAKADKGTPGSWTC